MGRFAATEEARFWRDNAGQLREMARAPVNNTSAKLIDLANEYDRLADRVLAEATQAGITIQDRG